MRYACTLKKLELFLKDFKHVKGQTVAMVGIVVEAERGGGTERVAGILLTAYCGITRDDYFCSLPLFTVNLHVVTSGHVI